MIFVDAWAWLALAYAKDPHHQTAVRLHSDFRKARRRYVTTDYVLSEVITYLFGVAPFQEALTYTQQLLLSAEKGNVRLIYVSPQQFHNAWLHRQKLHDKPDISFVDLTSMAVMQDLAITDVFTGDAHFQQVGLGFALHPGPSRQRGRAE